MASARKKQDEKNLKTLRELGALPQNKYCFDCNQRGPTYVNVTIGSFVCTKCSGMLRGITPPHRVKSISMATFTPEEIDLLRNKGNEYCRRVWLGLYDGLPPTAASDEQTIRDHMLDKYERRRYYLDPGFSKPETKTSSSAVPRPTSDPKPVVRTNGVVAAVPPPQSTLRTRPEVNRQPEFADFDKADIFTANNNSASTQNGVNFANFDNNPVFSNQQPATNGTAHDDFSIFDLQFTNSGPVLNQVPLFPKCCNLNNQRSLLTPATLNNINAWQQQSTLATTQPPVEDKYAALKDLDNALKTQTQVDWGSTGSNGSLYSSPTPTGSMYSSSSPQSSLFGSPSQSNFMSAFSPPENGTTIANPFGNGSVNWPAVNGNGVQQAFANPFRDQVKMNGFAQGFPNVSFPNNHAAPINGTNTWAPNPFKVGAMAAMNSNNPFL